MRTLFHRFVEENTEIPLPYEKGKDFSETKVLFVDKFQNETRMLDSEFYEISYLKMIIFIFSNICLVGIPLLFSKWSLSFKIKSIYIKTTFSQAKFIKIIDKGFYNSIVFDLFYFY